MYACSTMICFRSCFCVSQIFYCATQHRRSAVGALTRSFSGMLRFCGKRLYFVLCVCVCVIPAVSGCDLWELAVPLQLRFSSAGVRESSQLCAPFLIPLPSHESGPQTISFHFKMLPASGHAGPKVPRFNFSLKQLELTYKRCLCAKLLAPFTKQNPDTCESLVTTPFW